jgi:methyl coenzyme M reductase subunit D
MTLLLKEDKVGVYIKLLKTDVWIHKTNIATEIAIEENSKKMDKMDEQLVPAEYHEYLDIFSKEKHTVSPNQDLGTTRSK